MMSGSSVNPDQDPVFDPAGLDMPALTRNPNQDQVKVRV